MESRPMCLRAFTYVDVAVQNEPPEDPAARVTNRKSSNLEPPVRAVGTPEAVFELVGLTETDRTLPRSDDAGKVVRMDDIRGHPLLQFIERLAEVAEDVPVHERDFAVGRRHRNEGGNAVDDLMKRQLVVHRRSTRRHTQDCRFTADCPSNLGIECSSCVMAAAALDSRISRANPATVKSGPTP